MEQKVVVEVPADRTGDRLDRLLADLCPEFSRSRIQKLISGGSIDLNGSPARSSQRVSGGDQVHISVPEPESTSLIPEEIPLDIFYEDEHLLVINKPPGMIVHPAGPVRTGTLVNAVLAHCDHLSGINGVIRPGIVHRLDKDTSGLLMVAKDDATHRGLAEQLEARTVHRRYMTLVWGRLSYGEGRIQEPVGRHARDRKKMAVVQSGGRHAATRFETMQTGDFLTLLAVFLETGRTHQIRVHMNHIGHSVFADMVYGGGEQRIKGIAPQFRGEAVSLLRSAGRQMLHAADLGFIHPVSSEDMHFQSRPPPDMEGVLTGLGMTVGD
jgi:23S rRNA pseudouridine1911/1915/1917 synthase